VILFFFHTYLIFTNQTTQEIYHKSKVPYINKFKELKKEKMENLNIKVPGSMPFHPFDMGCLQNFRYVYFNNVE